MQKIDQQDTFTLKFSHNIIEHLGLKLYQNKPTNVIAELVSNAWDANANKVYVELKTNTDGTPDSIIVADDGIGMSENELRHNYLVIGKNKTGERHVDDQSPDRAPMGRKGIGKLAPFGVAKMVELISIKDGLINWLVFDYASMIKNDDGQSPSELKSYQPEIKLFNTDINHVNFDDIDRVLRSFIENKSSGTIIVCKQLSLSKTIHPDDLKTSLGRRFTVTLNRPDFQLFINNELLTEKDCLPDWELRIPDQGFSESIVNVNGKNCVVKFWVGFVGKAQWSHEQAGVGVYAHGKIAQDRPFFFDIKGSEIFSRYMYAVIEADWIDELDYDAISTDRTSVDWTDKTFNDFHNWGQNKVREWVNAYKLKRQENVKDEIKDNITQMEKTGKINTISPSEKVHLINLLAEVTPALGKEAENKERLIDATVKAWTHEPARRLINKLWKETSEFDANQFSIVVNQLADELVPESLSLAVVFSQRVYALTQLYNRISLGKETQLQKLLEDFPWILGNHYDSFVANSTIKKTIKTAVELKLIPNLLPELTGENTRPDFVFLSTGNDKEILVIELKGPELTVSSNEMRQLSEYLIHLSERFPSPTTIVKGVLIAGNFSPVLEHNKPSNMEYKTWNDILLESRINHMYLLAGLLAGTDVNVDDSRVQQICQLGGEPVMDFLAAMSKTSPELKGIVDKFSHSKV